jgi:hypothetical protein
MAVWHPPTRGEKNVHHSPSSPGGRHCLAAGASKQEILVAYPALTDDDINAATTYAAESTGP